jgi:GTP cyclohydrolase II
MMDKVPIEDNLMNTELTIKRQVAARIPTRHGTFQLMLFTNNFDNKEHLAFVMGDIKDKENVLLRVHSECFTGDIMGSLRCDCGEQLDAALATIAKARLGVILYLRQEGRGIGLADKLRAYNLQDQGLDTVEANLRLGHKPDERDYTVAALMIRDLGIRSIKLLTNNPQKINDLSQLGVTVRRRVPVKIPARPENLYYLQTKKQRMDHMLDLDMVLPITISQNA